MLNMKKFILFFIVALSALQVIGQGIPRQTNNYPVRYQSASTPYAWRWGTYDSVLKIPFGPQPILREGGQDTSRPGALFFNTSTQKLMVWSGSEFLNVSETSPNDTIIDNVYIGTLAGLRLNQRYIKFANIVDYGTGTFVKLEGDNTSLDNTWQVIVDLAGVRYGRQWDNTNVQVEWFIGPDKVMDTADKTTVLQLAVNAAQGRDLWFSGGRKYRSNRVYLPLGGIRIHGNGAILSPSMVPMHANSIFQCEPFRNSNTTGLYVGGTNNTIAPNIKTVKTVLIEGFTVDLEFTTMAFTQATTSFSFNTVFEDYIVKGNTIKNFSRFAIAITSTGFRNDTSSYFKHVDLEDNVIFNGNPFSGVYLTQGASVGDTSIWVQTDDYKPIPERLAEGNVFWIGSHLSSATGLDNTGFATTNKLLRLKRYVLDPLDSSKARLDFSTGSYQTNDGFIDSLEGLGAAVIANAMLLPPSGFVEGLTMFLSNVNGTAGQNFVIKTTNNTVQNAYWRNMYPGKMFTVNSPVANGTYRCIKVSNDTAWIDQNLRLSISNLPLIPYKQQADAITIGGDIKQTDMIHNTAINCGHLAGMAGTIKAKTFSENLDNRYNIERNKSKYVWMSFEITTGGTARASGLSSTILNNISMSKSSNWINIGSPGSFKLVSKDLGFGTRKLFTSTATADANVAANNSEGEGDLVVWSGAHLVYKIVDCDSVSPTQKRIKVVPWDHAIKDTVANAKPEADIADLAQGVRVYCDYYGQEGTIRYAMFKNNTLTYSIRNGGGAGYHISGWVYESEILNNTFEDCERSVLELGGYKTTVADNTMNLYTFTGAVPMPSLTKLNGASGRGFNGWFTCSNTISTVKDNIMWGFQPEVTSGYNPNSGSILVGANTNQVWPQKSFNITGNEMHGLKSSIIGIVNLVTIGGVSYPSVYYDDFNISDNKIFLNPAFNNTGLWNYFVGKKFNVTNNTVTRVNPVNTITSFNLFRTNSRPNIETFDSTGNYDVVISKNQYPSPPVLNVPFNRSKIIWNDLGDMILGVSDGYGYIENGIFKTTTTLPGGGGGSSPGSKGPID